MRDDGVTTSAGRSRASRIALVVAGHLRELCSTDANFDASPWSLVQTVRACRRVARCDVFVYTWSTLDQQTRTWHDDFQGGGMANASACIDRLRRAVDAVALAVDEQPAEGCPVHGLSVQGRWPESQISREE